MFAFLLSTIPGLRKSLSSCIIWFLGTTTFPTCGQRPPPPDSSCILNPPPPLFSCRAVSPADPVSVARKKTRGLPGLVQIPFSLGFFSIRFNAISRFRVDNLDRQSASQSVQSASRCSPQQRATRRPKQATRFPSRQTDRQRDRTSQLGPPPTTVLLLLLLLDVVPSDWWLPLG